MTLQDLMVEELVQVLLVTISVLLNHSPMFHELLEKKSQPSERPFYCRSFPLELPP